MRLKLFAIVLYTLFFALLLALLIPASAFDIEGQDTLKYSKPSSAYLNLNANTRNSSTVNDAHYNSFIWSDSQTSSKLLIIGQLKNQTLTPVIPAPRSETPVSTPIPTLTPVHSLLGQSKFSHFTPQKTAFQEIAVANPLPTQTGKPTATTLSENGKVVVLANNQFAIDLYSQLANDHGHARENIFFSPWSISSAFAITYEGARGDTADEIRSVFHFPSVTTTLREGYSEISTGLNSGNSGYILHTANALWAEKTHPFLPDYISTADRYYGAKTANLDFIKQPDASRITINRWVEDQTRNRIKDLIPDGAIDSLTTLVITNAVYFKGTWEKQFDTSGTAEEDFHVTTSQTVRVQMMKRTDKDAKYWYTETDTLQVLGMPYAHQDGNELSMLVLLPKDKNLEAVEHSLDARNLAELNQALVYTQVYVYFPRFRMETTYSLSDTLSGMGMPSAFGGADFSGMDGTKELFIDAVFHKAFVDVNEEGTEAAAATAVVMTRSLSVPIDPIPVFRADHPFIFLIQDNDTGNILFMGRMVSPAVR
jgi:serpin B